MKTIKFGQSSLVEYMDEEHAAMAVCALEQDLETEFTVVMNHNSEGYVTPVVLLRADQSSFIPTLTLNGFLISRTRM
jgi:uncharacterized protein VirK/YbjX